MKSAEYKQGRIFLCRLEHDSDLLESVARFAEEKKVRMGVFTILGAVKRADLAYYDQNRKEYQKMEFDRPLEVVNIFGNISTKDGKTFAHAHAALGDPEGRTYSGHLLKAVVFAGEVHLQELMGDLLEREHDPITGLSLWNLKG